MVSDEDEETLKNSIKDTVFLKPDSVYDYSEMLELSDYALMWFKEGTRSMDVFICSAFFGKMLSSGKLIYGHEQNEKINKKCFILDEIMKHSGDNQIFDSLQSCIDKYNSLTCRTNSIIRQNHERTIPYNVWNDDKFQKWYEHNKPVEIKNLWNQNGAWIMSLNKSFLVKQHCIAKVLLYYVNNNDNKYSIVFTKENTIPNVYVKNNALDECIKELNTKTGLDINKKNVQTHGYQKTRVTDNFLTDKIHLFSCRLQEKEFNNVQNMNILDLDSVSSNIECLCDLGIIHKLIDTIKNPSSKLSETQNNSSSESLTRQIENFDQEKNNVIDENNNIQFTFGKDKSANSSFFSFY